MMNFLYPRRARGGGRAFAAAFALVWLAGCGSAPKRPEAARDRQCGKFCLDIDRCLESRFDRPMRDRLCALARCESGCRAAVVAPAGYVGAFQFDRATWREVCGPIFERAGRGDCRDLDRRKDLCCASLCTATVIEREGAGRWPHCGA